MQALTVKSEQAAVYNVTPIDDENAIIARALQILESRFRRPGTQFNNPDDVKNFLKLSYASFITEYECFCVTFLNAQHELIEHKEMFRGTLTQCSIYPREIVRTALQMNAAAVFLSHNHPSGNATPSRADELLTTELTKALNIVDVKVLDHVIVTPVRCASFAEMGIL